jgi:hypothetical protein
VSAPGLLRIGSALSLTQWGNCFALEILMGVASGAFAP